MSGLTSCFRLKHSGERIDWIDYHRELIKIIGFEKWCQEEERRFGLQMFFYDRETLVLEDGRMAERDLTKRRQLLKELSIEHCNLMSLVMEHHFSYLTT
jgi:hypothetical protein